MLKTFVCLIFILVFGAWSSHEASPDTSVTTQDHFSLDQFLGRWFEMAVISTCPHFMQRKMRSPAVVEVNLQHSNTEGNITVTTTTFRNESCKTTFTNYTLTDTPGKFFYHVPQFGADVDVSVVGTNYVEHAQLVLLSTEKPAGDQTLIAKLYGRSKDASEAVMENFRMLARKLGMNEKTIVVNRDRGQC